MTPVSWQPGKDDSALAWNRTAGQSETGRLEAFSADVLAVIIITIMAPELKAPSGCDFASLRAASWPRWSAS